MARRKQVAIGLLGTVLDAGKGGNRWEAWRPTVALCQHEDLLIDRFDLLGQAKFLSLAKTVAADIRSVSPETEIVLHTVEFRDPWDFEDVFGALHSFARVYPFDPETEDYLVHITTGTHVAQICLFLLTESHYLPAKLVQTSPPKRRHSDSPGSYSIIDLDLSKYDRLAERFRQEKKDDISFLKSGIETRNPAFNTLIEQIERVAIHSRDPILLMGPTGAGKSKLARRIYELKKGRRQVSGEFVEVNCATIRGDGAMSALFGHKRGAFTGAVQDRPGLLKAAAKGILFLDEVGELGLDEQAMLLRAVEEKTFLPVGSDREVTSDFQLLCGTNRDLQAAVAAGKFRDDLLARINFWTYRIPGLTERREDIEPNIQYELERFAERSGTRIGFNKEARDRFLLFATSASAKWTANFRDLNGAITRMATLAAGGRVTVPAVEDEITRLKTCWGEPAADSPHRLLVEILGSERAERLDRFDQVQLAEVLRICRACKSLSQAGRQLFSISREQKTRANDADRLRKYLERYGLKWQDVSESVRSSN